MEFKVTRNQSLPLSLVVEAICLVSSISMYPNLDMLLDCSEFQRAPITLVCNGISNGINIFIRKCAFNVLVATFILLTYTYDYYQVVFIVPLQLSVDKSPYGMMVSGCSTPFFSYLKGHNKRKI